MAHYDQMSYVEFYQQPAWYQELMIAHYRTHQQKEAVWTFAHKPKK